MSAPLDRAPEPEPARSVKPECRDALDKVYAYVDGEMGQADVEAIRAHLESCAPCLEEYDLEAALKALVRRSCQDRAPDHLRGKVLARITQLRAELDAGGAGQVELTEVRVTTEG